MTDFSREVDSAVAGALNPGEQVLWRGHCLSKLGQQRKAEPIAAWKLLLVTPLACLGAFVVREGLVERAPGAIIGGGVFLAAGGVGIFTIIRERFRDSKMFCRRQTAYVLTDQRAFVLRHCRTEVPMRSISWRYVDEVRAEMEGLDGRGTVMFWQWDPVVRQWDMLLTFSKVGNADRVAECGQAAMLQAKE